jgi:hypothetical protein
MASAWDGQRLTGLLVERLGEVGGDPYSIPF